MDHHLRGALKTELWNLTLEQEVCHGYKIYTGRHQAWFSSRSESSKAANAPATTLFLVGMRFE
jgi:hypothetical protein